jgi:large subunit ribosomal protein L10
MMAEEVISEFQSIDSFIIYGYEKLTAQETHALRSLCVEKDMKAKALKNTMAALAFSAKSFPEELKSFLNGSTAIVHGSDIASVAKLLISFKEENKKIVIKGGYIPGKVLSSQDVEELSKIPSREQLLSMLAGAFNAPLQQIATIMAGPLTNVSNMMGDLTSKMDEKNIEKVGEAVAKAS